MKMRKSEHFTRSSSSIQGQAFNVKFTDKMFETLFSSLYRYKEAASLRETLCNGIDSHNMRDRMHRVLASHYASLTPPLQRHSKFLAPKGKNVVVHLPDDYEPWLEIRDYGVGLTLEQIIGEAIPAQDNEVLLAGNMVVKEDEIPDAAEVIGVPDFYEGRLVFRREDGEIIRSPGLYTTLFHSTKEDDDGQIGAFGLGSKSPFAVSDSFTVESRMEGKLHRFLMYLNSNRIPTVDLVTKDLDTRDPKPEDTEEFNGITVKIPVKNSRFSAFAEELVRLGRVMRPDQLPEVENAPYSFRWKGINYDYRVNNTYIQSKDEGAVHYAVMGGVSYPIDLSQLDEDTSSVMSKFPCSYTFFELGALNVPPSREDLSYDEFTRETLSREFRATANAIMKDKMKELKEAQMRGPLALYVTKGKLSEMFGSGFRKMVEKEYPADARFNQNKYVYPSPVQIDRDYNETAPFSDVGHPFGMEVHQEYGEYSTLGLDSIKYWLDHGQHITVVIEDTVRARNLKIKQLRDTGTVVIIAKPETGYVQKRNNAKDHPAFKNAAEIRDYMASWVGEEETTVDYLTFADKFVDWLSAVINPTEVKFMSELTYVTPPVTKDPGMFKFTGRGLDMKSHDEVSGETISDIINKGERIVYIEMSGHECIHKIMGTNLRADLADKLRSYLFETVVSVDDNTGERERFFQRLNVHKNIFLARRKSVPMMKKFPEVFIPIDQVFDIIKEENKRMLDRHNAVNLLKSRQMLHIGLNRLSYGETLLAKAFGEVDKDYERLYSRFTAKKQKLDKILDEQAVRHYHALVKETPDINERQRFTKFMGMLEKMCLSLTNNERDKEVFAIEAQLCQIFERASNILTRHGFEAMNIRKTVNKKVKLCNRKTVEKHLAIRFFKEHYKPTALNAIESESDYIDVISNAIIGA